MEAERNAVDRFTAAFLSSQIGAEFAGRIDGHDQIVGRLHEQVEGGRAHFQLAVVEPGGDVGTQFDQDGLSLRLAVDTLPVAGWRGSLGAQFREVDFSALGEEAYVPATLTKKHAAIVTEEYRLDDWRFEAGLRHEWQDIDVSAQPERGTSARGTSLALGAVWKFAPQYSLRAAISRSHRLPGAEELYADGIHLATSTWEIGNENLVKETSNNIDVTLRKFAGPTTFSVSAFHNRVDDYIYARTLDNHEGFQLVEYAQHDATFTGIEGEVRHQVTPSVQATRSAASTPTSSTPTRSCWSASSGTRARRARSGSTARSRR